MTWLLAGFAALSLFGYMQNVDPERTHSGSETIVLFDVESQNSEKGDEKNCSRSLYVAGTCFPDESFLAKSTPAIIPGGNVVLLENYLSFAGNECLGPVCEVDPKTPNGSVTIDGDAVIVYLWNHYFHFVYDVLLRLWPLRLHAVFDYHPDPTIVWYGDSSITHQSEEMLKLIWPDFPLNKTLFMGYQGTPVIVKSLSRMIIPRHNQYHDKYPWKPYNDWILNSIRDTMNIAENPQDEIFVSRKGHRRGILLEDDLFASLLQFIPKLKKVLPDDFSVAEQARMFANAKLIIAPHGGSLTNAIFSNWEKVTLIEITKQNAGGFWATFRMDLQVKHHFLLKCQSSPCNMNGDNCDPWDTPIDADVENLTLTIRSILSGNQVVTRDFFIERAKL